MLLIFALSLLVLSNVYLIRCESGFNSLVDELMINLNKDLTEKSMCNISLSNLKFEVSHSLLYLFPMDVEVQLSGGSVAEICTLKRTGDVSIISMDNDTVSLQLNLGLGSLSIAFADVEAWAMLGIYTKNFGSIYVTPSNNSISVDISVTYPRTVECSTSITSLSVALGTLDILLNGVTDADLEKTADVDLKTFSKTINNEVSTKLAGILGKFDICNKIVNPGI